MGIYIKGMEMPDRCFACPLCDAEVDDCSCAISHGSYIEYREIEVDIALDTRPDWCPLIEVPPHGRLIDADMMEKECCHGCKHENNKYANCIDCALANAPTIIEAEEGE